MTFSISLNFDGDCRHAINHYSTIFGVQPINVLTYGEMDTSFDENVKMSESGNVLIANSQMNICGTFVTFSDMPDNFEFVRGNNLALCVSFPTYEEAISVYNQLGESGTIFVPLTMDKPSYSLLADKFNVTWNVSVSQ